MKSQTKFNNEELLCHAYFHAKRVVIKEGYEKEIEWQDKRDFNKIKENEFLKEAAWVILASGMSDVVVSRKFCNISESFFNWASIEKIIKNENNCKTKALSHFNHSGKINAIFSIAQTIYQEGFEHIKREIHARGIDYIITFPFMGPATSYHFAKNIGINVAKPDRHLIRIADMFGCRTPHELCSKISDSFGDKVAVVDIVLWRYATIDKEYENNIRHMRSKYIS